MRVKAPSQLTLKDRLSRLDSLQAGKLLGPRANALLPQAGNVTIDIASQVLLADAQFQIVYPEADGPGSTVVVTISLHPSYRDRLQIACSHTGEVADFYRAAAISLVLEEKTALGLAEAPPEGDLPWELVPETGLEARALAEREKRAAEEKMTIKPADRATPWTDFVVASALSGKAYRVALRGLERGQSYCSCPDFRKNRLGTCKHVIKVQSWVKRRFEARALRQAWKPDHVALHVRYDGERRLALEWPEGLSGEAARLLASSPRREWRLDDDHSELFELLRRLNQAENEVVVFPDAEELLNQSLHRQGLALLVEAIRQDPAGHPLRREMLKAELLPYQLDGIAFAAGAGRAVLADEMGLGKTIQGVGVAEFLARQAGISRVLVVCPASLKSQWWIEIERFCDRSVQLVAGRQSERADQYRGGAFFTVCNYEQVLRDFLAIERAPWDLVILDEAQRIKNWEAKTSRIIKSLRSRFALVLTGTPLENRLDDLYSIMEFIDEGRLGPAYRFLHQHRVVSETGRVLGYKNLDALRDRLKPVLLRRTRTSVSLDLPPRQTEIVRIQATEEQKVLHNAHMQIVQTITRKKFITEMDLLRLQKALLMARMSADSTFLCDKKEPSYSSKLQRLGELLEGLCAEPARKIILFSEWTTMLDQIEPILRQAGAGFVRLDGSVPQKQRQALVTKFQTDPQCRAFLTTNAGSTGLNLQAADTVINIDLPWNPALLEQRIARAHRMGQKRKVQVYLLITEGTIEENLLGTLSAKHELAAAVLDPDSNLREVQLSSGMEELKRRLEVLLGASPAADPDLSVRKAVEDEVAPAARQTRVSEAAGQMVASAFTLLGEMLSAAPPPAAQTVAALEAALQQSVVIDDRGQARITLTLPDSGAVKTMAEALARLLAAGTPPAG